MIQHAPEKFISQLDKSTTYVGAVKAGLRLLYTNRFHSCLAGITEPRLQVLSACVAAHRQRVIVECGVAAIASFMHQHTAWIALDNFIIHAENINSIIVV